MKRLLLLALLLLPLASQSEIVVVVHKSNPVDSMSKSQIIDLFMGRYSAFPNGQQAKSIDNNSDSLKEDFYTGLTNMSLARVNSYWSRIKFTGRARPPAQMPDTPSTIKYINDNPEAIGYIRDDQLSSDLKVVYEVNE